MWRSALVVLALCVPVLVQGQTIELRSGEHDGFSRLVLPIPPGTHWQVETGRRAASVQLALSDHLFDTASVFKRIPRRRLTGLSQSGKGAPLDLTLGCDCSVVAFVHARRWLVVDIADAAGATGRIPLPGPVANPLRFSSDTGSLSDWPFFTVVDVGPSSGLPAQKDTDRDESIADPFAGQDYEDLLNRQLARASRQGLLTLRPDEKAEPSRSAPGSQADIPAVAPADLREQDMFPAAPDPRVETAVVSAVTSIDREMPQRDEPAIEPRTACLNPQSIDIAAWGDDRPFAEQVAARRQALSGEFDRIDAEAVRDLARTLLHFGFGAEARRVLQLDPSSDENARILIGLSRLLDGEPVGSDNPFEGQQVCGSDAALWGVLAATHENAASPASENAILRAFSRLPEHLRDQLASRLSAQLTQLERLEAAEQVLRTARRGGAPAESDLDLADARIHLARGSAARAVPSLSRLSRQETATTPQALIALIDAHWRNGSAPAPDDPERISAYEAEYGASVHGAGLRRAHALSLALLNRFDAAFEQARRVLHEDERPLYSELIGAVLELLVENGDDLSFLHHAAAFTGSPADDIAPATRLSMARRFLALGFPEPAKRLLSGLGADNPVPDHGALRLLRAQLALDSGRPHRAMVELLSQDGPEAARLRAQALLRTGDPLGAATMFDEAGDPDAAARARWMAGSFRAVAKMPDTPVTRAAELVLSISDDTAEAPPDGALAEGHWLLSQSEDLQSDLTALFSEVRRTPAVPGDG